MKFDLFLSLCQAEVDGYRPSERTMFEHFFDQVKLADSLGFEVAWVAEGHFSSEVQKQNPGAVIPHFKGEVAVNSDVLHLAHRIFHSTKKIQVGSAIRNILCNGGPLAHAEMVKMFLAIHGLDPHEERKIHIGFASGRFPFSNKPYGIAPRNDAEKSAWNQVRGKLFLTATEIFLRALRGEEFSSQDLQAQELNGEPLPSFWAFDKMALVPRETPLHLLQLVVGSHDPAVQDLACQYFPCWVFNLSITPTEVIEETHRRMQEQYAALERAWRREYLPRTTLVFLDTDDKLARTRAEKTVANYWRAMQGTVEHQQIEESMSNALWGNPQRVAEQVRSRFHKDDRIMLWFDFNCHDNDLVKKQMVQFWEEVYPLI